jgi:hypothetical protein
MFMDIFDLQVAMAAVHGTKPLFDEVNRTTLYGILVAKTG